MGVILWHFSSFRKICFKKWLDKLPNLFKHIYTLFLVIIGWLIFAFEDINLLKEYIKTMFGLSAKIINNNFIYYFKNYFIILFFASLFSTPIYKNIEKLLSYKKYKFIKFIILLATYIILLIITISYLVSDTYNPFLYFRF